MKSESANVRGVSKSGPERRPLKRVSLKSVSLYSLAFAGMLASGAQAQTAAPTAQGTAAGTAPGDSTVVVVTGFRASLQSAIAVKKKEDSIVDVIKSSDIAAFPDMNLAESIQRIPGVSIDRDGGEGRTITVRGLTPDFTTVRIDGFDAQATTGGRDVTGGANRSRGVDFNVFASELFNGITVRKSMTAEEDEGSLGAIVDLDTVRPFDFKGFTMGGQLAQSYNDLDHKSGPRGSFLISNRWADGKLGAALAFAFDQDQIEEEGPNTTRWEDAFTQVTASSVGHVASIGNATGTSFITDCTAATASGTCGPTAGGSAANLATSALVNSALHPRIPRYTEYLTDEKRTGIAGSFQARPNPDTTLTLDTIYSDYYAPRQEFDLEAIGLSRSGAGLPASSIYDYTIDPTTNTITKASYNGMDIRAEHRYDDLDTRFTQINLIWDQKIGDRFTMKASLSGSRNVQDDRQQSTFTVESYNVNGYSYDFTNPEHPVFNYGTSANGCSINQTCYWSYDGSTESNGSPNNTSTATSTNGNGDASLIRLRPYIVTNGYGEAKLDTKYEITDHIDVKAGVSFKKFTYTSIEYGRYTTDATTRDESANSSTGPLNDPFVATVNGDLAKFLQPVTIAGTSFYAMNLNALQTAFNYTCNCDNPYGQFTLNSTNSSSRLNHKLVTEDDGGLYVQTDFDFDLFKMPVRGNLGVRQVSTGEDVQGYVSTTWEDITRKYDDTLPSLNLSIQPLENVLIRFAAAKTMARPALQDLAPGGSITTSSQTIGSASAPLGNPYLNPIRSNNLDLSFEWYPDKDGLITLGFFRKDIKSYYQTVATTEPFSDTGYPIALLNNATGQDSTTPYIVYTSQNTPGGLLNGYEINFEHPFTFLPDYIPGFFHHFGVLANYTNIASKINYILSTTDTLKGGPVDQYGMYNLLGMSPIAWNGTLYYADKKWDARVSVAARSDYLSLLNPGSSVFAQGKHGTTNVDTQVTYALNAHITLVFEGLNLTNQYNQLYDIYNIKYTNTAGTAGVPASVNINNPNAQLEYDQTGRTFYFGVRYKY